MAEVKQIDDPSLSSDFHARVGQKRRDQIEYATTADKILGLLQDEPITVNLTDDISLQFFPPTDEQFIDILALQGDGAQIAARIKRLGLSSDASDEEAEEIVPRAMDVINQAKDMLMSINGILAVLSVDRSWTAEKFKQLPKQYKTKILTAISGTRGADIKKSKGSRKAVGVSGSPKCSARGT